MSLLDLEILLIEKLLAISFIFIDILRSFLYIFKSQDKAKIKICIS